MHNRIRKKSEYGINVAILSTRSDGVAVLQH